MTVSHRFLPPTSVQLLPRRLKALWRLDSRHRDTPQASEMSLRPATKQPSSKAPLSALSAPGCVTTDGEKASFSSGLRSTSLVCDSERGHRLRARRSLGVRPRRADHAAARTATGSARPQRARPDPSQRAAADLSAAPCRRGIRRLFDRRTGPSAAPCQQGQGVGESRANMYW
jgi:hypothetical protein